MSRRDVLARSQNGFTLVEVILALTIFALMGVILFSVFSLSHRAVERSEVHFERNQKIRSFDDLIGGYIRSSYPYRASPQDAAVYYSGEADRLSFVSSYSLAAGGRGMAKIHLSWGGSEENEGIIKLEEEVPVRLDDDPGEGGQRHSIVLQEGVKMFQLAYLDSQSDDDRWEERWDAAEKRTLPRAVRLSYRSASGRDIRRVFPVMVAVLSEAEQR
jgi:prepilin-type N-terminal cleavage/methylation domain-containing protein